MKKFIAAVLTCLTAILLCLILVAVVACAFPRDTAPTDYSNKTVDKIVAVHSDSWIYGRTIKTFDFTNGKITYINRYIDDLEEYIARYREYYEEYERRNERIFQEIGEYIYDMSEWQTPEEYEKEAREQYNVEELLSEFSKETGEKLLKEIIQLGFYNWEEHYRIDGIVCDGGVFSLTVYFTDGTEKKTSMYCKYPENLNEIDDLFEEYLGYWL